MDTEGTGKMTAVLRFYFLVSIVMLAAGTAAAQDLVHGTYVRVAATFQLPSGRRPPTLRVKTLSEDNPFKGAYFDRDAREIVLDQRLVDRLLHDPALGEDALAFILGHELGPFCGDHPLLS